MRAWRSHGATKEPGIDRRDRGRVYGQADIGDGEFLGLNAVSIDVLSASKFPSCSSKA